MDVLVHSVFEYKSRQSNKNEEKDDFVMERQNDCSEDCLLEE